MQFLDTLSEKGVQIIQKDVKIVKDNDVWIAAGEIIVAEPVTTQIKVELPEVLEGSEME